jgi:hypothetical protein
LSVERDHVFILCAVDAPEAAALSRLGLKEGPPNTHPGQGTACRRFMFHNAYIELLWVCDERQVRSPSVQRTRLWERWSQRGQPACPFGIVLRPTDNAPAGEPPFPTWAYTPDYLAAGLAIDVAMDTPLNEPEFFYLGFQRRRTLPAHEPFAHAIPATVITDVKLGTPVPGQQSPASRSAVAGGVLSFSPSSDYVLGLTFDGAETGSTADLRPDVPLVLHW